MPFVASETMHRLSQPGEYGEDVPGGTRMMHTWSVQDLFGMMTLTPLHPAHLLAIHLAVVSSAPRELDLCHGTKNVAIFLARWTVMCYSHLKQMFTHHMAMQTTPNNDNTVSISPSPSAGPYAQPLSPYYQAKLAELDAVGCAELAKEQIHKSDAKAEKCVV
ncbi:hypothetical protein K439DRAFT_1611540 [Ramaria rubella]|nr:hypothetical protein K439DRAFT_1611540 [Ramaria rubella]